jgi:hypothetical protein
MADTNAFAINFIVSSFFTDTGYAVTIRPDHKVREVNWADLPEYFLFR